MINFDNPKEKEAWNTALNTYTKEIKEATGIQIPKGMTAPQRKEWMLDILRTLFIR